MTEKRIQKLKRRLQEARFRLLSQDSELAAPLLEMLFVAAEDVRHMSTNGACIYFDADWLGELEKQALDFMLLHQLMHIRLSHIDRPMYYKGGRYHLACDIVANGHLFVQGWQWEKLPKVGNIYAKTFYPEQCGWMITVQEALRAIPFDPDALEESKRNRYSIDSEEYWDKKEDRGENGIIVLAPWDEDPDDLSVARYRKMYKEMKLKKKKKKKRGQGNSRTEEERSGSGSALIPDTEKAERQTTEDEEERENKELTEGIEAILEETKKTEKREAEKYEAYREEEDADEGEGGDDDDEDVLFETDDMEFVDGELEEILFAGNAGDTESYLREWYFSGKTEIDWRVLLRNFVELDLFDYSFTPPDRRFSESDLFLPDYHAEVTHRQTVLFMVDTSGSISDEALRMVYTELHEMLKQMGNSVDGVLCFFDTKIYSPTPFQAIKDLQRIIPKGGGGTDFACVFHYLKNRWVDETLPSTVVIFTDGDGHFPPKRMAQDVPVLWVITDEEVTAPWGKTIHVTV